MLADGYLSEFTIRQLDEMKLLRINPLVGVDR